MKRKKYILIALGLLSSLLTFTQVYALGRIDAFTFYIPYYADILDDQFDIAHTDNIDVTNVPNLSIETVISIAVQRGTINVVDTIIYYDHWEDGLEADITSPILITTQVWGDGDLTNGIAPTTRANPDDTLMAGDIIVLRNAVPMPRDPTSDPQQPNNFLYDGGDMLTSLDSPLAVTLAAWPNSPDAGILFAGAWELYPTNRWGADYIIPIGEDVLRPNVTAGIPGDSFGAVGLNVQAVVDGTTVEVDWDADGNVDVTDTLDQGEQLSPQIINGVNSGARVQANNPVQVHVFTGDPAEPHGYYEARAYTIIPRDDWTDDYMAPRSSDGDFWLYNPDLNNSLDVTVQTSIAAPTDITILPGSVLKYPAAGLNGSTGTRFTSTDGRPFYGVAALDDNMSRDWGYALMPVELMTTQTLVGWGVGNNEPTPDGDESHVYVTAVNDTTIYVDYDADGTVNTNFAVLALEQISITDPDDHDMTGAFLFTDDGVPFIAVWGQDESAPAVLPSIDVGTSIVPLPSLAVQKTFNLAIDNDCSGSATMGDTIRFELEYFNFAVNDIRDVIVEDFLPPELTYTPNSTTMNGAPIPDGAGGLFPLEGGYNIDTVPARDNGFLTFDTVINNAVPMVVNTAEIRSNSVMGSDSTTVLVPVSPSAPVLEITKALIDPPGGLPARGETITFSVTITNSSGVTITKLPLQDTFNEDHLTFLDANPSPNLPASGVITWNDLTTVFGSLPTSKTISMTVSFLVDQSLPPTTISTTNTATILEAERSDSPTLLICNHKANVNFAPSAIDLQINKTDGGVTTSPGGVVLYTLAYNNLGPSDATGVVITETVPDHATFNASVSQPTWSCPDNSPAGAICTFYIGPVASGTGGLVNFAVTVNNPLSPGVDQIFNTAIIGDDGASGPDLNPDDNISSDNTPISITDPRITKMADPTQARIGDEVNFSITVSNPEPPANTAATGVTVVDTLPVELDLITYTVSPNPPNLIYSVVATGSTIRVDIPALGVNQEATLNVTARVNDLANPPPLTVINLAVLDFNEGNPREDTATVEVVSPPQQPPPDTDPPNGDGDGGDDDDDDDGGDDDDDDAAASDTHNSQAVAQAAAAQPALPVTLLPETGTKEVPQTGKVVVSVVLLLVTLLGVSIAVLHVRRN